MITYHFPLKLSSVIHSIRMRFLYQVMYRIGFTPWDTPETPVPAVLRDVIEGPHAIHPGRALDLGCGMGRHAIYMAMSGWKVAGIDSAGRALRTARQRAEKAGVQQTQRPSARC
jgi:2-polyprenyl-3-methyl-5-hydroxy-6-metoxy-1,4-benzoquinol methylase